MTKPTRFMAEYRPKGSRPNEPILIGRDQSQARVTVEDAIQLSQELERAINYALREKLNARS